MAFGPVMGSPYATAETNALAAYLGLTQAQIFKCRDLRNRFYRETRDLRYDLFQKQLEMRKLFADPKATEVKLLEKEKELGPLRQRLMALRRTGLTDDTTDTAFRDVHEFTNMGDCPAALGRA